MQENRRNILVIGVSADEFNRVAPFLSRDSFDVDRFPSAVGSFDLTHEVPFEALIVRYPLPDMELYDFLKATRREDTPNRSSPVVILSPPDKLREAEGFVGRGANRVVSLEDADSQIQTLLSGLLNVAPRKAARFLARMEVKIGGESDMILCETDNISSSGMLLKTDKRYDIGTQIHFEFTLPNDHRPIVGFAEIMRHTVVGHEKVGGVGLRFLSFAGDSQRRFDAFIQSL